MNLTLEEVTKLIQHVKTGSVMGNWGTQVLLCKLENYRADILNQRHRCVVESVRDTPGICRQW